jgi:hypothetical protein
MKIDIERKGIFKKIYSALLAKKSITLFEAVLIF